MGEETTVGLDSLGTFSGLFTFFAFVALLNRRITTGALFLTVAGAAGLGVFWDRWSRLTGYEVQIRALWNPVTPTESQVWLFVTHLTMLMAGLALLCWLAARHEGAGAS